MKNKEAFDYGKYEEFYADPRTKKVMADIDKLATKMNVKYALIGGMAAYLNVRNPPEDYPDIDILVYSPVPLATRFIYALIDKPGYKKRFVDEEEDSIFGAINYEKDIQIDIFTSLDEAQVRDTRRIEGIETEMIEPLIVEKLIRGTDSDIRMALDLLAFADYNRSLLAQIAREYRATGLLQNAMYFARRMTVGKLAKSGIDNVVRRLAK